MTKKMLILLIIAAVAGPVSAALNNEPVNVAPSGKISGIIIGVPAGKNVAGHFIDQGEIQGIQPGMQFGVYRNKKLIAIVEVVSVLRRMSAVKVVQITEKEALKPEDRVELWRGTPIQAIKPPAPNPKRKTVAVTGGPERPVKYPELPATGPAVSASSMQYRINQLEKRVEDLEKLLARTLAMIPQVPPEEMAIPPIPDMPGGLAAPEIALVPPKKEDLELPVNKPSLVPQPKEVNPADFWRSNTPYDMAAPPAVETADARLQRERDEANDWLRNTPQEKAKPAPRLDLAIELLKNGSEELHGGAKFTNRSTFRDCDDWLVEVRDAENKKVKSFKGKEKLPETIDWDGTNDAGVKVLDGFYSYSMLVNVKGGQSYTDEGNISPRSQALADERDWKSNTIYQEGAPGNRESVLKEREKSTDVSGVLVNIGKALFTVALVLLIL